MVIAGNFAPGNAGVPFYMDIFCPGPDHCSFGNRQTRERGA
jgi:hypothetical protein